MIAYIKQMLRRRKLAQIQDEISRVRALRMSCTQKEFSLRGQLAVLESRL